MTVADALRDAAAALRLANIEDAEKEARLLLALQPGWPVERQLLEKNDALDAQIISRYQAHVRRRAAGEPYAYLSGFAAFLGRDFQVGPGVLVPRPETEQLTEWWIAHLLETAQQRCAGHGLTVVDLCCGSGCIGLSAALAAKEAGLPVDSIWLADISLPALDYASRNAARLAADLPVRVIQADLFFSPWPDADAVFCNPPYIDVANDAALEPYVLEHEPREALDGGTDGLVFYRRLAAGLADRAKPGTWVGVEHGYAQALAVKAIFMAKGFDADASLTDYSGHERGQRFYLR